MNLILIFMAARKFKGRRPKICSIYAIENLKQGTVYVGSSVDTAMRWNSHLNALVFNKHPNSKLQGDWNKYGGNNFTLRLLKVFINKPTAAQLRQEEQALIDSFNIANLYNLVRAAKRKKV